jgi:hypothetical protein
MGIVNNNAATIVGQFRGAMFEFDNAFDVDAPWPPTFQRVEKDNAEYVHLTENSLSFVSADKAITAGVCAAAITNKSRELASGASAR